MLTNLFEANTNAPDETVLHLSTAKMNYRTYGCLFAAVVFACCAFTAAATFGIIAYALLASVLTYGCIADIRSHRKQRSVQLRINDKGVYAKKSFTAWSRIEKFEFETEPTQSAAFFPDEYLVLHTQNGRTRIQVNHLSISTQKLNYLLKIYRQRSNTTTSNLTNHL